MQTPLFIGALALALTAQIASPQPAAAQTASDARFAATTLDLTGHGEARLPPDLATIELGVTTEAATAGEAMADNAAAMTKVIAATRAKGVEPRQIVTSSLNLAPQYAYAQGAPPRLTGYQATNRITVTLTDLTLVGPVVDAGVAAGANDAGQVSFGLKSRVSAENFARLAAIKALEDKAAAMADAAGYHIGRLVHLSEAGAVRPVAPVAVMSMARMQAAAVTPVETGEMVVSVDVAGEFELTR
ncbi:MAG TPA: SIMPL domain-containing protein [Caulobacteraceae bacterium]|jgi:uncharacterized protein YggE|nr:SIMPL domain-containing protein [Caulobacteraceae bacterium]